MSAYLLIFALLITAVPTLAQSQNAARAEPQQNIEKQPMLQIFPAEPVSSFIVPRWTAGPLDLPLDYGLCFKMRSYVVKRDSKDSDSVHPVGYSTCQPASRYRLRTTEIRSSSPDR